MTPTRTELATHTMLASIAIALAIADGGCFTRSLRDDAAAAAREATNRTTTQLHDALPLQLIAIAFIAAGGLALVLSYLPIARDFNAKKAAAAAVIFGLALQLWAGFERWAGNWLYGGMLAMLVIVGGCAAWPYAKAAELALARWRMKVNGRLVTRDR